MKTIDKVKSFFSRTGGLNSRSKIGIAMDQDATLAQIHEAFKQAQGIIFEAAYTQVGSVIPAIVDGSEHNPLPLTKGTTTRAGAGSFTIPLTFPAGTIVDDYPIAKLRIRVWPNTAAYFLQASAAFNTPGVLTVSVTAYKVVAADNVALTDDVAFNLQISAV